VLVSTCFKQRDCVAKQFQGLSSTIGPAEKSRGSGEEKENKCEGASGVGSSIDGSPG